MSEATTRTQYGCESMVTKLRRVLVRRPDEAASALWRDYGWRSAPDFEQLLREHDALCALLESRGAEIVFGGSVPLGLDAIYTFDPAIVSRRGAIVLRPGKDLRLPEAAATADDLAAAGIPLVATLEAPASADGGDTIWLDGRPVAGDLAVAYLPLMPVRLVQLLADRGIRLVEVPDEEFETMGPNVLALEPGVALVVEGNPETRRRLERAGVEVLTYEGTELSKGDGGPTCLTRPLLRD